MNRIVRINSEAEYIQRFVDHAPSIHSAMRDPITSETYYHTYGDASNNLAFNGPGEYREIINGTHDYTLVLNETYKQSCKIILDGVITAYFGATYDMQEHEHQPDMLDELLVASDFLKENGFNFAGDVCRLIGEAK